MASFLHSFLPLSYSKNLEFRSSLSSEECVNRLKASVGPEGVWKFAIYHEVRGEVHANGFQIHRHYGRNSWLVTFKGVFAAEEHETRIRVHAGIPESTEPFVSCIVIVALVWGIGGLGWTLYDFFNRWHLEGNPWTLFFEKLPVFLLVPIVVLLFHAIHLIGQSTIAQQEELLIAFLCEHTQATQINNQSEISIIKP